MEKEIVNIRLKLPKDVNYRLSLHMAKMNLKKKRTKAEEIIRLLQIGLLKESKL